MASYEFMILDSLQKVFPGVRPECLCENEKHFYAFGAERLSFQLACYMEYAGCEINRQDVSVCVESPFADQIHTRLVKLVPSGLPAYREQLDDNYLFTEARLCPDLLTPLPQNFSIRPVPFQWQALWFDLTVGKDMQGASHPVTVKVKKDGLTLWEDTIHIHVLPQTLPAQKLIHTCWFHADCLADYYKVPVFSEEHWRIIQNFIDTAVKNGMNMLLTPIFTPPLDTAEGGERTTVQLVGVTQERDDTYHFDFSLLRRWIRMCSQKGIRYIEISHLFTQWGAKYAPKIIGMKDGVQQRLFGWDTPAVGGAYTEFLHQFLPQLKDVLKQEGVFEHTYFHISDEPHDGEKETYAAAKESVADLLCDCRVIDALSSYELFSEGIVEHPVPCNDHIQPFLDAGVRNLWTYYCCAQGQKVSNRFLAMPPARNRILGVQLYLYELKGFLHWGFNFYNAQHSLYPINPYLCTDADGSFPSGDPFVVYPAEDKTAYESMRLLVFAEALQDLRALYALEELVGRERVTALIHEGLERKITFSEYPKNPSYLRRLRRRVYEEMDR